MTKRLSTVAGVGLVVVAATGVFRAVIEVQTWANLVTTVFGIFVLLKVGLICVLAGLGAFNRYRNIPRLPRALRTLRRMVSTEVLVGLGALTVAAALVNIAPPAEYAAAAAQAQQAASVVVTGSDFATTVKVQLTVTPGTGGFNRFDLRVTDYDTGANIAADSVVLQFTQPLRPQLGTSTLTLKRQADGTFQASGGNVSIDGIWEVAATIQHGQQSAEVHLQLTTGGPAPSVTVQPFSGGLPTLYTIQLGKAAPPGVHRPRQAGRRHLPRHLLRRRWVDRAARVPADHRHDPAGGHAHHPGQPPVRPGRPLRRRRQYPIWENAVRPHRHPARRRGALYLCCHHARLTVSNSRRPPICLSVHTRSTSHAQTFRSSGCRHHPAGCVRLGGLGHRTAADSHASPALANRPSSPAHIWFISPTANETVTGPVLHIDVGISGAQLTTSTSTNITPTLGHIHLYTNNSLTYMNYKPTLDLPVAPGVTYAIYAEFVATDHFPFNPRVKTPTIFVHVAG